MSSVGFNLIQQVAIKMFSFNVFSMLNYGKLFVKFHNPWNFSFLIAVNLRDYTIYVVKTKVLISYMVTALLIYALVFAYTKSGFLVMLGICSVDRTESHVHICFVQ